MLKKLGDSRLRKQAVAEVIELTNLTEVKDRHIKTYSGGMRRRLGIAQALLGNPSFIIVDEPTTGLDPQERLRFRNLLVTIAQQRTVLLSSHITEDISASCHSLFVLHQGKKQFEGTVQSLVSIIHDHVWQLNMSYGEEMPNGCLLVSTASTTEGMCYRVLAAERPTSTAISLPPTIEDAYLWLTHNNS